MSYCSKRRKRQRKCQSKQSISNDYSNLLPYILNEPFIFIDYNNSHLSKLPFSSPAASSANLSAANIGNVGTRITLAVSSKGTAIPLPNAQSSVDFIADSTNTTFTVPKTDRYQISYIIMLDSGGLFNAGVTRNGTLIPASAVTPSNATTSLSSALIMDLTAGDLLTLQLSADNAGDVTFQEGIGAYLYVTQVGNQTIAAN